MAIHSHPTKELLMTVSPNPNYSEEEACQAYRKTARLTAMTPVEQEQAVERDRKSTRLNSSHWE